MGTPPPWEEKHWRVREGLAATGRPELYRLSRPKHLPDPVHTCAKLAATISKRLPPLVETHVSRDRASWEHV